MSQFKKVGAGGLWKKDGQDGSTYYSGKIKLDPEKIGNGELFISLSKSEKRTDTSPDLWLTAKVKEDDGWSGGPKNEQPPPKEQDEIPF